MSKTSAPTITWIAAAVLIGIGALLWFNRNQPANGTPPPAAEATSQRGTPQPERLPIATPVEPDLALPAEPLAAEAQLIEPDPIQLPPLNESDAPLREEIAQLAANDRHQQRLLELVTSKEVLRKVAIVIENGAIGKLSYQHQLIQPPGGAVQVRVISDDGTLRQFEFIQQNYDRFNPYIELFNVIDNRDLIRLLKLYQPLLDEAYGELGIRGQSFNQRLVAMLDVILAAPTLETAPTLVRESVRYKYKDPTLEALPDLQKLMVRMGPDNTRQLKAKLTDLRRLLLRNLPAETPAPTAPPAE
jgi:hypothetical protein